MTASEAQLAALARARSAPRSLGVLPAPLPPRAADATEALHDAIAARPAWTVPCRAAADPSPWTSDDEQDAEWAAEECAACPVLDLCEAFGIATRSHGVVLAGRRWTKHSAKNLSSRNKTASATAAEAHERKTTA